MSDPHEHSIYFYRSQLNMIRVLTLEKLNTIKVEKFIVSRDGMYEDPNIGTGFYECINIIKKIDNCLKKPITREL